MFLSGTYLERFMLHDSFKRLMSLLSSFLDKVFHHNDSAWRQFSCGRLDLTAQLPSWNYNDSHWYTFKADSPSNTDIFVHDTVRWT